MTQAAIYARFSSDKQRDASIDDQVRVCYAEAKRQGWHIIDTYTDYAMSGSSSDRPGYQRLIADLAAGDFDIVLAESLDRLSRDQEHLAGLHKAARFHGVRIWTIAEQEVSELAIGFKGTMASIYLRDLAQKVHRGLEGRVQAGHSAGGVSYGYRVKRALRADGTPVTGEVEIVVSEAEVVRRIFEAYNDGQSPRAIAKQLNAQGVPGPRNGKWTASLLLGTADRENGMLCNHLYVGERVWNRQHFIKDPRTNKRVARLNPREVWIRTKIPELAVIDLPLWEGVQRRLAATRRIVRGSVADGAGAKDVSLGKRLAAARRPTWVLSGLVRCGLCAGPMSVVANQGRLGCANHVERGTCANRRTVLRDRLLARVLTGLKHRLLAPELVEEFVRTFVAEVNAANRDRGIRQAALSREQGTIRRQIHNILDVVKDGRCSTSLVDELRRLEDREKALERDLAQAAQPEFVPTLHPSLPELYRRRVEELEMALADPQVAASAREALRSLIDAILVFPGERRGEVEIHLRGDLAAFLHLDAQGRDTIARPTSDAVVLGTLVAGIGFEPMIFRL